MVEWKDIEGYEGLYHVSNEGIIWSIRRNRRMAGTVNKYRGYREVCLVKDNKQKTFNVHQLVARAFLGPARGRQVRHKDGDPLNNKLSNLCYGTALENQPDRKQPAYKGKRLLGVAEYNAIKEKLLAGAKAVDLAMEYRVSYGVIYNVELRATEIRRQAVLECIKYGYGVAKIAEHFNITYQAVVNMMKNNGTPVRELRKKYPLNKSLSVAHIPNIINVK